MTRRLTEYGIVENSGEWSGLPSAEARQKMAAYAESKGLRQGDGHLPPQGLGHLAPALLGHADSDDSLREVRHRAGAGEGSAGLLPDNVKITGTGRSPLEPVPEFVNVTCPKCGGLRRRETRHHGHVRRFVLVFLSLLRCRTTPRRRSIPRRSRTGSRSISTSAASSTPFCT